MAEDFGTINRARGLRVVAEKYEKVLKGNNEELKKNLAKLLWTVMAAVRHEVRFQELSNTRK